LVASALWKTAKGTFFLSSSGIKVNRRTSQITMDGANEWLLVDKVNTNVLAHIWIELEYQTLYMPTLIIITLTD
jgi:hypothetical protein